MKKKILIILGIILVLLIVAYGIIFFVDYHNVSNGRLPAFSKDFAKENDTEYYHGLGYSVKVKYYKNTNNIETIEMYAFGKTVAGTIFCYDEENTNANTGIITIKDGKIQNENLLDTFLKNTENKEHSTLQINNTTNGNTETITLEYVLGKENIKNDTSSENTTIIATVPDKDWTYEDYQNYYGYYKLIKDNKEEKYDSFRWGIKRQTTGNIVQVVFYSNTFDLAEIPVICEYNLDTSLYEKTYDLTFLGRKDMGVDIIAKINEFDNIDYGLYTIGGDVEITLEQDMVYSLENALNDKIISVQSILDQAILDEKYGICESAFYHDGGSIEYMYRDYTILKFNSLDGNRDLIIGPFYSIINNENLRNEIYKNEDEKKIQDIYSKVSLSIKENTLNKTGATIIISDISEQKHTYEEWFRIDKKENDYWEELKPIDDNYGFKDIGLLVGENNQLEINTDWSKIYGELEKGQYRLVKDLYDNSRIYLTVEFAIE